ncbi:hypothetical protein, partial [uncultured Gammaproteobacteria bacterium]
GRSRPKKQKLFYWYDYSQYYSRYSQYYRYYCCINV